MTPTISQINVQRIYEYLQAVIENSLNNQTIDEQLEFQDIDEQFYENMPPLIPIDSEQLTDEEINND